MSGTEPRWQDDAFLTCLVDLESVVHEHYRLNPTQDNRLTWALMLGVFTDAVTLWRETPPSTGDPDA
jgi:hypothetical protein